MSAALSLVPTPELDDFGRGWSAGFRRGAETDLVATIYEDLAGDLLRVCGVPLATARAIAEQASCDVAREHPELPLASRRALAARRIARLVTRRVRRMKRDIDE
jgi:hypothetical protein